MPNQQPQNDVEESMPSSILPKVTDEIRAEYAENNNANANNSKKKRPCLGGIPTIFCAILIAIAIAVTVVAVWISKNPAEPPSSVIDNNNTTSVSNAASVVSSKPLFIPWEDLEDENHFLHDWYNETKHEQQQQQLDDLGDTNEFLNDWDNETTDDELDIYVPPDNNNCVQKLECLPCLLHRCFVDSGYLSTTENIWDAMGQGSLRPHPDSRDDCRKLCPFTEEECGQGALCGYPRDREGLLSCVDDIENVCVEEEPIVVEEEPTTATPTPSEDNNCEQKTECLPCLVHRCFYGREDDIDEVCNETCPFTKEVCGQGALCGYPPDIKGLTYCIRDIETECL